MKTTILSEIKEQARVRPQHPSIVEASGRRLSYGELWQEVQDYGDRYEEAGIGMRDYCGFMASDGANYVAAALGVMKAGGVLVPIPESHRDKSKSLYFQNLSLDWLIDEQEGFEPDEWSESPDSQEHPPEHLDMDPAFVRFTSGTTGARKGVLLGHRTIRERTDAANRALEISPEDRILWMLSMDHHFVVSVLTYLKQGATILIPEYMLADSVCSFADEERATVIYATPYHYRLLNGAEKDGTLDELRLAISTADDLSTETANEFYERFQKPIRQALGIIEVGLPVMNLDAPRKKPDSVGQVLPDYEVTVVDDEGQPVPDNANQTGELHIDGPGLFDAYLRPWKPREQVVSEYGFPTGDEGRVEADGDVYIEGRRVSRINQAGNKFFCEEVEQVLNKHPGVRACRVYGKSHQKLGEVPCAEVVPGDPENMPADSDLKEHCRQHLASYKIPRVFEQTSGLPRTPTGKIKRT